MVLPKKSKNSFSVNGDTVSIMREEWDNVAFATYREDYYNELTSHTWSLDKGGYPVNQALGGGLHRYMMEKWYGKDILKDMSMRGFVVDHMNNIHTDCRVSNLEFLKHNRNVAKGQYFDKESSQMSHHIAVSMFKDFKTECYQITIGCNDSICSSDGRYVNVIKLLYNCAYSQVVLDAESILTLYDEEKRISLDNLKHCDQKIIYAPDIKLTDEERQRGIVIKDGVQYLIIGNGKNFIKSVHYDKGWKPTDK